MVSLNGYNHYIDIRGTDRNNPVLLILHGGPGWTIDSITKKMFRELEEDFTIVNWHQRGAGRSISDDFTKDDMSIELYLDDTVAVINYLRDEFHQDKVVLLGHSWGTVLGSLTSKLHPELIHAYIGVSQMTDTEEMINSSKVIASQKASDMGEKKQSDFFKTLDLHTSNPHWLDDAIKYRDELTAIGGTIYGFTFYTPFLKYYIQDGDYRLWEKYKLYKGIETSINGLYPDILKTNIYNQIDELEVPYILIQGKHDMLTMQEHSLKFYNKINSPSKKYYLFENSAHSPYFEEPEKFMQIMRSDVKPLCIKRLYVRKNDSESDTATR